MFAANFRDIEVPEEPIVIGHEAVKFAIPFLGQFLIKLLEKWQQWPLWAKARFVRIYRDIPKPAKAFSVRSEAKPIEKVLATNQGNVPEMGNTTGVFSYRYLRFEPLQQLQARRIIFQVLAQLVQSGELNWRADKEHRLVLEGRHYDFVRRADAINVGGAVRDGKIAGVDHAKVDMKRLPELSGAPGTGLSALFSAFVSPVLFDSLTAFNIFAPIFVETANIRFEPGIEDSGAQGLQKLTNPIAPTELFLGGARSDKIHGAGQIDARALEQAGFLF